MALLAITNKDHYLEQVKTDKSNWSTFFNKIKNIITPRNIIYELQYGVGPYFIIFTEYPTYVCNLFKKNGYLVRDKSDDLGRGCVRVSLSIEPIMNDIFNIITKINGFGNYKGIYLDLDKTIRENYLSKPFERVVEQINKLKNDSTITIVTNNYNSIENYLIEHGIHYDELIQPLKNFKISDVEYTNGYFIRDNGFYLLKFPLINYQLFNTLSEFATINVIEEDEYEDTLELGNQKKFNLPFIGEFIKIMNKDNDLRHININIIGKQKIILNNQNHDSIMIGDSLHDLNFAINNTFYFKFVNSKTTLSDILDNFK